MAENSGIQWTTHTKRFEKHFAKGGNFDCWIWTGAKLKSGYGVSRKPGGGLITAHRVAYILANGGIADNLQVDHLCRNRACVNPAHLEANADRRIMEAAAGDLGKSAPDPEQYCNCPVCSPAPAADDARCGRCGKTHFEGDCKLDPTYADRHVVAETPAAETPKEPDPSDKCKHCGHEYYMHDLEHNGKRRCVPQCGCKEFVADQAGKAGLAAELDAMSAYDEIEDQVGTDDEFAAAEAPLLKMLKQPTTWTEETLAFHESLICLIAALRKRGGK